MKIGLSLSLCIKAMLDGEVNPDDVLCIISGTKMESQNDWLRVLEDYEKDYWYNDPEKSYEIVQKFRATNRIIQPRIHGQPMPYVGGGKIWLEVETPYDHINYVR